MASITLSLSNRASKDTGKSEVLLRYRNTREVALRAHTHVYILPKFFNGGEIVIKQRILTEEVREAHRAKADVDRIVNHLTEEGNKIAVSSFTQSWAQETIDRLLFPEQFKPKSDKIDFYTAAENYRDSHKISDSRKRFIRNVFGKLMRFEAYNNLKLELDTFTREMLVDFANFCRNEHLFYEPAKKAGVIRLRAVDSYKPIQDLTPWSTPHGQCGENSITHIMRQFKSFWIWCLQMDYTTNNPFKNLKIKDQCYGTPYYMTIEERDQLYNTPIENDKVVRVARDMFVFQCFLGCRAGDLLSLTKDNVVVSDKGTAIQYIPRKTKDNKPHVVKVYLAPTAIEILHRYLADNRDYIFPIRTIEKYNKNLRKATQIAGIDRIVTTRNPTTGESEQHRICDIASSHMARRTFIGNLYKKVKDPNLVGKLSGHVEGSKAFARYRDIDDDMIREMTELLC